MSLTWLEHLYIDALWSNSDSALWELREIYAMPPSVLADDEASVDSVDLQPLEHSGRSAGQAPSKVMSNASSWST